MPLRDLTSMLAIGGVLALAGCGDDAEESGEAPAPAPEETATFEPDGFGVSFEYPADFEEREDVELDRMAGAPPTATSAVGLEDTDLLVLARIELGTEVGPENLDEVRARADELFSELAGEDLEGDDLEVAGLPGVEYEIALDEPAEAETRAVALFDGDVQYLLNCQSTPELRERIEDACELALETFEVE